jgi:hypothetical protein
MRYEVPTVVNIKATVLLGVPACILVVNHSL